MWPKGRIIGSCPDGAGIAPSVDQRTSHFPLLQKSHLAQALHRNFLSDAYTSLALTPKTLTLPPRLGSGLSTGSSSTVEFTLCLSC